MKNILCLLIIIFSTFLSQGKKIDIDEAKNIAINFLSDNTKTKISIESLRINNIFHQNSLKTISNENTIYSFDIGDNNGYILVSSTDKSPAVIAYTKVGSLDNEKDNIAFRKYISLYLEQVNLLKSSDIEKYISSDTKIKTANTAPLLKTIWGQTKPFNKDIATDPSTNKNFPTGCIATAMAQIMNFHKHPKKGFGNKKYYHSNQYITLGELSANMSTSVYNWDNFANEINTEESNSAIDNLALLHYDCGVSVEMNYNKSSNGGSGAYMKNIEKALETSFNYHTDTRYIVKKFNDSWQYWENLIIDNLNQNLPIIYSGVDTEGKGGHAWVLDGFENRNGNNYFHMNWGWNGSKNTYVLIKDVIPTGTNLNYSRSPRAIMYIKPDSDYENNLIRKNKIIVSQNKQYTKTEFSFDISNVGDTNFDGKLFASIYDEDLRYIGNISSKQSIKLSKGETKTNITLISDGINLHPGNYYIAINEENKDNKIEIVKTDNLETYQEFELIRKFEFGKLDIIDKIQVSDFQIKQNKEFTVIANIVNNSDKIFEGHIIAGIFDFEGFLIENIELKEVKALNIGDTLKNITFHTDKILSEKGKYILAISEISKENYLADMIGYENDDNEIIINIADKDLLADKYENNNTSKDSKLLEMNFADNIAIIKTNSTNIHLSGDLDFYKLEFEENYEYTISVKIQDIGRSDDGKEYTCDVIMAIYDTNTKEKLYDDFSNIKIIHDSEADLFVAIASYFPDDIGTYSIDMTIERKEKIILSIDDIEDKVKMFLYPNPSSDIINLENINIENSTIEIFNTTGNKILQVNNTKKIDIRHLTKGLYILKYKNKEETSILKFIKN